MAVKSNFAAGDVLQASDVNTYLTNGGLVYITGTSISSSSSYIEILNCFSSTYDNYRIVINNIQASSAQSLMFYLGTNATSALYYGTEFYYLYTGASSGYASNTAGNAGFIGLSSSTTADGGYSFDLNGPNLAKRKTWHGTYDGREYTGWFGGFVATTTQYTGIRFLNESGNLTAGTIRIYGYRQA